MELGERRIRPGQGGGTSRILFQILFLVLGWAVHPGVSQVCVGQMAGADSSRPLQGQGEICPLRRLQWLPRHPLDPVVAILAPLLLGHHEA